MGGDSREEGELLFAAVTNMGYPEKSVFGRHLPYPSNCLYFLFELISAHGSLE
jgi:hypothetical protein